MSSMTWEVKDDGNKFKEVLGCDMDEEESDDDTDVEIPKPVKPIFSMSFDENCAYLCYICTRK